MGTPVPVNGMQYGRNRFAQSQTVWEHRFARRGGFETLIVEDRE
jgi:hypothetical protein